MYKLPDALPNRVNEIFELFIQLDENKIKGLSLYNAILKAKQYDEQHFITCNVQNNYGISNSDKNQSIVAREKHSIKKTAKLKGKLKQAITSQAQKKNIFKKQKVEIDLTEDLLSQMLASSNNQEYQLTLRKCELAIEERELKLERENLN
ncbi:hypothetical protein F8M41_011103 [Gigaspora margarita]|uniref:Uncharacterized protein n=1 Tax=Gigaspora margarita TaxID=4874 RepID=A0A8H4AU06_GIGMA|nr:hypothetical protein F8M41_011103 [Gigaspora margarita]